MRWVSCVGRKVAGGPTAARLSRARTRFRCGADQKAPFSRTCTSVVVVTFAAVKTPIAT